MSDTDKSFLDEIDATFANLEEAAKEVDEQLDSAEVRIKPIIKSFNMSRTTVCHTALGVGYLQGMPGKEAMALLRSSEKVSIDDLMPHLLKYNVIRFRALKNTDVGAGAVDTYSKLILEGYYGIELANQYALIRNVPRDVGLKDMMGVKPKKEVIDSIKGLTYARGIKDYVKAVRSTMEHIALMLPAGTDPVLQIYPDSQIEKGDKEIKAILADSNSDLGLDDL